MSRDELVIKGGVVLLGAPLQRDFRRTDLRAIDGIITEIGPDLSPSDLGGEVIDVDGGYVLPGFVDAHQHLWEASLRGVTASGNFTDFLYRVRISHGAIFEPDDVYAGVLAGALTSIMSGTTTVVDHMHLVNTPDHAAASLEAVRASGLRTRWSYGTGGGPVAQPHFITQQDRRDHARRLRTDIFAAQTDADRVTMGLAIADIGAFGWDEMAREFQLATELDLALTTHAGCFWGPEHPFEFEGLHRHGLLGPRQLYSHANRATDDELRMLAGAGASVVSAPETEMQLGNGLPVLHRAIAAGVEAGLGTDIQANHSPDMFTAMRLAMHTASAVEHQKVLETAGSSSLDRPVLDVATVYHTATLGGAQAAGLDEVTGSVEVGKAADLLVLQLGAFWNQPVIDPLATIVLQSGVRDVSTVIVGGQVLVRGGRLPADQADRAGKAIAESWSGLRDRMAVRGGPYPEAPDGLIEDITASVAQNLREAPLSS
jgi:5-methylthioadenosine/S-adenosylhomocysteine deaminase